MSKEEELLNMEDQSAKILKAAGLVRDFIESVPIEMELRIPCLMTLIVSAFCTSGAGFETMKGILMDSIEMRREVYTQMQKDQAKL